MKLIATGFLVGATVVYVVAKWVGGGWAGYVAAGAEAGMVGALADWFAVTALFRRPMGLPIPHTAIIATKKDALGESLGDFVGENFLSAQVVRARLRAVGIGSRLGGWLAEPGNTDKVTEQAGIGDKRAALRQEYFTRPLRRLRWLVTALRKRVLPKSGLGQACAYLLGHWEPLTAHLRRRFPPSKYVGIELEVNQNIVLAAGRRWAALRRLLVDTLRTACTGDPL